jgi:hypothetical protein
MDLTVETSNHNLCMTFIEQRQVTPYQLDYALQGICSAALDSLRNSLGSHIRTGLTTESLQIRKLAQTDSMVRYGVGSWSRGKQLYWLDQGRGEVLPVNRKYLKFQLWPSHQVVFARRAKPTKGIHCMAQAAEKGASAANASVTAALATGAT